MKLPVPQMRRARIEIVPMIDTIFFLLVFFMITWLSMVKMAGLGLTLPRENQTSKKPAAAIDLAVSRSGMYYVDAAPVSSSAWRARLQQEIAAHPNSVIVLDVDPAQKTQALISTIDSVNHVESASGAHNALIVVTQRIRVNSGAGSSSQGGGQNDQ